jgi:hypothetical protein
MSSFIHPSPSQRLSEPAATLPLPRQGGESLVIYSWFDGDEPVM